MADHSRPRWGIHPAGRCGVSPTPEGNLSAYGGSFPCPARSKMSKMRVGVRRAESPPLAERESGEIGGNSPPNPYVCLTHLSKGVIISYGRPNTLNNTRRYPKPREAHPTPPGSRAPSLPTGDGRSICSTRYAPLRGLCRIGAPFLGTPMSLALTRPRNLTARRYRDQGLRAPTRLYRRHNQRTPFRP